MITAWTENAWQDYLEWQKEDERILYTIDSLIKDIKRDPVKGSGNRSALNMPCKVGAPAASLASTA